jgi:hypothetical protein
MQTTTQRKIQLRSRITCLKVKLRDELHRAYQNHFPDIWPVRVDTEIPVWQILTPGSRIVLEKLTFSQIITKLTGSVDVDKCLTLATILSQISPVHLITHNFRKIHNLSSHFCLALSRAPHI